MKARSLLAAVVLVAGSTAAAAPATPPASPTRYVVKRGDSLYRIAGRQRVTVSALVAANGGPKAVRVIHPGQVLVIPRAPAAAGPTAGWKGMPAELDAHPDRLAALPSFRKWSATYRVPADLMMAVCWHESHWQPAAVSSAGAVGLCQVMPVTGGAMAPLAGLAANTVKLTDADTNVRIATRYLRWLLDRPDNQGHTGDLPFALTAYAQGLRSAQTIGTKPATAGYIAAIAASRASFAGAVVPRR